MHIFSSKIRVSMCASVCAQTCMCHVKACLHVHIDMRRHRGFSARLRKSHFVLASNPLPGTRPADSTALLFLHVCQMWHSRCTRTHTHIHADVVSSSRLFRHLSLPSETEFVNSWQSTPTGICTLCFTVPSQSHRLSFQLIS